MRSFQTLSLVLAASIAISCSSTGVSAHTVPAQLSTSIHTTPHRHLRVQHDGLNDNHGEVASDAGIPGYVKAAPSPALAPAPVVGAAPAPVPVAVSAPQSQINATPGASTTTNVNVSPGTINTKHNITPGTATTTAINRVAAPPQAMAQSRPATATAPTPMAAPAKPSTSGLGFDSLNPLSMVATLAHQAHGMLLGHTGTLPSSYMQGQSGGHGH